jgi:hypothetical protein
MEERKRRRKRRMMSRKRGAGGEVKGGVDGEGEEGGEEMKGMRRS